MNELVKINDNNQVTTDSLTVADRFGKRHRDVLRSIKLLKCSKDFNARNFAPVEYKDQKGEKRTYYDMTQDGWMFLVMGFTGERAAEWKEKFIIAFRAMETELKKRQDKPVIVSEHTRALPSGKKEIVLSSKAKEEIGGIVKAVVVKAIEEHTPAAVKVNGEVISVPAPVYKGIHTGLMALDPVMNNIHQLVTGACKKAIDEAFNMDIRNDNMFSLYKFVKIACQKAVREEIKKIKLTF